MLFFGVILLIIAVGSFFAARSQAGRLRSLDAADSFSARMLHDLYAQVGPTLGGAALAKQCEVEGTIEADAPLAAPLSNSACVAYSYTVTREYEEDETVTDAQGKKTTSTAKRSDTEQSSDWRVQFFVRDATGRVLINPEGAELDLVNSGERFDPAPVTPAFTRTRTLGHSHKEQSLAVGTHVYVLGCLVDGHGQPALATNPRDKDQKFIISRRSKRELTTAAASAARWWYYAAAGTGAIGLVLAMIGVAS